MAEGNSDEVNVAEGNANEGDWVGADAEIPPRGVGARMFKRLWKGTAVTYNSHAPTG